MDTKEDLKKNQKEPMEDTPNSLLFNTRPSCVYNPNSNEAFKKVPNPSFIFKISKESVSDSLKRSDEEAYMKCKGSASYSSGRWTQEEIERFNEGLKTIGDDWPKLRDFIQTRSSNQIRSHAQKHYERMKRREIKKLKKSGELGKKIFLITRMQRSIKNLNRSMKNELVLDIVETEAKKSKEIKTKNETKSILPCELPSENQIVIEQEILKQKHYDPLDCIAYSDKRLCKHEDELLFKEECDSKSEDNEENEDENELRVCQKGKFSHIFET